MPALVLVAALGRDRAIGRAGGLPWSLPDDLARFKATTTGGVVLMGRRTAESLGRALPGRRNLVLTRSGAVPYAGMEPVATLPEALVAAGDAERVFVIGGGAVYAAALPLADRLLLTHVDTTVPDADAWFPALPAGRWREVEREHHRADDRHAHAFDRVTYDPARHVRDAPGDAG